MPLAGRQLTLDTALARCYEHGWRGQDLLDAVALMCAESARYTEAYHDNPDSRDRGLFQINDKWHPDLSDEDAYKVHPNIDYAHKMFREQDHTFNAWMAYKSGAYKQFFPAVQERYDLDKWRSKVK